MRVCVSIGPKACFNGEWAQAARTLSTTCPVRAGFDVGWRGPVVGGACAVRYHSPGWSASQESGIGSSWVADVSGKELIERERAKP